MSADFVPRPEFEAVTRANNEIVSTKFDAVVTQLVAMNENMTRMHGDMEKLVGQYAVQTNDLAIEVRRLAEEVRDGLTVDREMDGRLQVIEKKIENHENDVRSIKRAVLGGFVLLLAGVLVERLLS